MFFFGWGSILRSLLQALWVVANPILSPEAKIKGVKARARVAFLYLVSS